MNADAILTSQSVQEFFKELIEEARRRQRVEVGEPAEFYLVNLLTEYLDVEKLFERESDGCLRQEPLALALGRALESRGLQKERALRKIGDTSLYVTGFFVDSLDRKLVDADYYMSMGHLAYSSLARLNDARIAELYEELAAKFSLLVDLLNDVSERVTMGSQAGLLRLYERFMKTGSLRLARLLAEQGVVPNLGKGPQEVQ